MASSLFAPLLGRHFTVQVTPQQISSGGVWSAHSLGTVSFTGCLESDGLEISLGTQDLTPINSFMTNPVPKEFTGRFRLTEIPEAKTLWNGTSGGSKLEACLRSSWYHKVQITAASWTTAGSGWGAATFPGTGTTFMQWTMYTVLTEVKRESPKGKTTYVGTFQLVPVGDGLGGFIDNPDYGEF